MNQIILASGSEGRKELFQQSFGNNFSTYVSDIDESLFSAATPKELVTVLAQQKGLATHQLFPNDYVCAFDTVVSCNDSILGKPSSIQEAKEMLLFLNNKIQTVWTGYAFYYQNHHQFDAVSAELILSMSSEQIEHYIQKHPVTKFAGSYAIQKEDTNIKIISGSQDVIIGAPMNLVESFIHQCLNN